MDKERVILTKQNNVSVVFFLMLSGYYLLNIFIHFLDLVFIKILIYSTWSSWLITILTISLNLSIIGFYIYYKLVNRSKGRMSFIMDTWALTIIVLKIFSIIISSEIDRRYLALWVLIIGITICLIISSFILRSKYLMIGTAIFAALSLINMVLPEISFNIPKGMTVTTNITSDYTYLLISIACMSVYYYFKKVNIDCVSDIHR